MKLKKGLDMRKAERGDIIVECGSDVAAVIGKGFAGRKEVYDAILDEVVRNVECVRSRRERSYEWHYIKAMGKKAYRQKVAEIMALLKPFVDDISIYESVFGSFSAPFENGRLVGEIKSEQSSEFLDEHRRYIKLLIYIKGRNFLGYYLSIALNSDPVRAAETVLRVLALLSGDER
ncbi:MAG: hypothetical protein QXX12_00350 [Nanopusillaceae archaeon]